MELSGYLFRNLLKKTRRRFSLSAGEQALYQELVDICNEENWSQSFQVSNGELTTALNCDEKTLARWRQSLINAGLIIYSSGKSRRAYGNYTMVVKTPVNIPTNSPTNLPTNMPTNLPTNMPDYIQLNKTKPKNPQTPDGGSSIDFTILLDFINTKTGKSYRVISETVKKKFLCRLKEGYSKEDIGNAIVNACKDDYHISTGYKYLTPEFFSRQDKLDKFMQKPVKTQMTEVVQVVPPAVTGPWNA